MFLFGRSSQAAASYAPTSSGETHILQIEAATNPINATTTTTSPSKGGSKKTTPIRLLLYAFLCYAMLPLTTIYAVGYMFISLGVGLKNWVACRRNYNSLGSDQRNRGVYYKLRKPASTEIQFATMHKPLFIILLLCSLLVLGVAAKLKFPSLGKLTLFGSLLSGWYFLAIIFSFAYPISRFTSIGIIVHADFVRNIMFGQRVLRDDLFMLEWNIVKFLSLMQYFGMILSVWRLAVSIYPHLDVLVRLEMIYDRSVKDIFTWPSFDSFLITRRDLEELANLMNTDNYNIAWTLESLLLATYLYFVYNICIMLKWKMNCIYKRFRRRIVMAGFQLYYLSIIIDGSQFHELRPCSCEHNRGINIARLSGKSPIEKCVLCQMHGSVGIIADFITQTSLSEGDIYHEIARKCQPNTQPNNETSRDGEYVTEEVLQQRMGVESGDDAKLLLKQLQAELLSEDITYEAFRKWMVHAHEDCLSLAYTLNNAFKLARILNDLLSWIVVTVAAIFWLLATPFWGYVWGLIRVGKELLIPTALFGLIVYASKPLFQGLFFLFVIRPFHIGDRCTIEQEEFEITEIGIYKTTCKNINTGDEMTYLNSDLQTRFKFRVLKAEPNLTDEIQLVLDNSNSATELSDLKTRVLDLLSHDPRVYENSSSVLMDGIGTNTKMSVRFDHTMNVRDYLNPSKSFRKKNAQRSELLIEIKRVLDELNIRFAAAP